MNNLRKKLIGRIADDDVKWDNCFVDLGSLGVRTNTRFTAYDPPKDREGTLEYDRQWEEARSKKGR